MKTFIKLLKNLMILSVPLWILCIYALFTPMYYMSEEYALWAEERDTVNSDSFENDPETLIIGDSRAKSSFIPEILNSEKKVYNIAIGGATSVEMYFAVKNYLKNHAAPEKAYVVFAPYHFCEMDNWGQTLYYNYLSLNELMEAEADALIFQEKNMIYPGWKADILSFKLRLPNKYLDQIYTARFRGNFNGNTAKYNSVREAMGYTAFGEEKMNAELNYETHHPDFDLAPMADRYYIKLLDLLEEKEVNVTIEQAPVNEASDKEISKEFRKGYDDYMGAIAERYSGFTVEREIPVYENQYFGDNNHLNRRGAEKFSEEIRDKYF